MKKNNTYFYGGAFNPMTLAHLEIIKDIIQNMNLQDILIIGITDHSYKQFKYDYDLRYKIVYYNVLKYINPPINKIKIVKQDKRTWNFLNQDDMKKYFPITLVLGEDEYNDLKDNKWHYSKDILNTYSIKIIPRTNNISSTKVRELFDNNASYNELKNYITEETYEIIKN